MVFVLYQMPHLNPNQSQHEKNFQITDKYDQYLDAGYIHAKFYFMDREAEWGKLRRQLEKEEVLHRVAELARLS